MRKLLVAALSIVLLPSLGWGWSHEGHQIIAAIAEDHVDETTKVNIQAFIGNNHLYSIATWADDVRRERPETKTWHYVNIPFGRSFNVARDCAPPGCVVATITELMKVLTNKNAPREQRAEALKFIVHFVGDVHQPMHAALQAEGGNGIHVSFLGSTRCGRYECNLHAVWDTGLIQHTGLRRDEYAQHEEELIRADVLDRQSGGTPELWANQSLKLAQAAWVQNETDLDERYYQQEIAVVDRQMALAGLRLARLLNESIGKITPRDFAVVPQPNAATGTD